jgi:transposase
MVLDADQAEVDLAEGRISCQRCGGVLAPWTWARTRHIHLRDGSTRPVRPRRARCGWCRRTEVLLPAWCLPRRRDALEVVVAALAAKAEGRGHRRIAADLDRSPSTVRRWLRRARGGHVIWLYRRGVHWVDRLNGDTLSMTPQRSELGYALTAVVAAVHAYRRWIDRRVDVWSLIGMITSGRLLAPT